MLDSDFSLPQVRVLYEIANAPAERPLTAAELVAKLAMDPGYLSRLLKGIEDQGLILRAPDPANAKRRLLRLTDHGRDVFKGLNAASADEVRQLLQPLTDGEQQTLVDAMARVRALLGDGAPDRLVVLRDPGPGDLGYIVHRHGFLYAKEYGWDWTFEALVSDIVGQFVRHFVVGKERCWIAERDGAIVGSVFVVRQDEQTAKLRLLYVDPSARGIGLGHRLVEEAIRFAQVTGYKRMVLWTNANLIAARRIYEAKGFILLQEDPHFSFGHDLVGQTWGRDL